MYTLFAAALLLPQALAGLDSRVRASSCRSCLQDVQQLCSSETSSDGYADCFCSPGNKGWGGLRDCVTGRETDCEQDRDLILNNYGDQCFGGDDVRRKAELCGKKGEVDAEFLFLVKKYCRVFVPPVTESTTEGTAFAQTTFPASTTEDRHSAPTTGHGSSTATKTTNGAARTPTAAHTTPAATPTKDSSKSRTTTLPPSSSGPESAGSASAAAPTSTKDGAGSSLSAGAFGLGVAGLAVAVIDGLLVL